MISLNQSDAQYKKMMETPIPRLITTLSIPTIISSLITVIYNTADTYFVSQIDKSASAAVGVVFSIMSVIQALGFGLGVGAAGVYDGVLRLIKGVTGVVGHTAVD